MLTDAQKRLQLIKELKSVNHDFKASVVAAEIIDNGVPANAIVFKHISLFKRFVSTEIEKIAWEEKPDGELSLAFELNKEGLYDMLPEAVTHSYVKKKKETASERLNEQRMQEKKARLFFSPIENEFAWRIVHFDIIERQVHKNDDPKKNRKFFEYFFSDSKILNDMQVVTLMYLLPLSHKIRCDVKLISIVIAKILNYKVQVTKKNQRAKLAYNAAIPGLGYGTLGIDTILNSEYCSYGTCYQVNVYDVPAADYKHFFTGAKHLSVINFIKPYFFPVNADIDLVLWPAEADRNFEVAGADSQCYLGFNSYI